MNLDHYLRTYTQNNSKWIKDLNGCTKTIKLLDDNIRQNVHDNGFGNDFLGMTPKETPGRCQRKNRYVELFQNKNVS